MYKYLFCLVTMVVTLALSGCATSPDQNPAISHEFVTVNTTQPILPPPSCVASNLEAGYKETCIEELQGYQVYLGKYLSKTCEDTRILHQPTLLPKPKIETNVAHKTDSELVEIVVQYTNELETYAADAISKYNRMIMNHNSQCVSP